MDRLKLLFLNFYLLDVDIQTFSSAAGGNFVYTAF